jgi:hypothetical protein
MMKGMPWKGIGIPSICIRRYVRRGKIRRIIKKRRMDAVPGISCRRRSLRMSDY